jgi:hypothetical protein
MTYLPGLKPADMYVILRSEGSEAAEATKNLHGARVNKRLMEILCSRWSLRMT